MLLQDRSNLKSKIKTRLLFGFSSREINHTITHTDIKTYRFSPSFALASAGPGVGGEPPQNGEHSAHNANGIHLIPS